MGSSDFEELCIFTLVALEELFLLFWGLGDVEDSVEGGFVGDRVFLDVSSFREDNFLKVFGSSDV
jgi:hypothetical protein